MDKNITFSEKGTSPFHLWFHSWIYKNNQHCTFLKWKSVLHFAWEYGTWTLNVIFASLIHYKVRQPFLIQVLLTCSVFLNSFLTTGFSKYPLECLSFWALYGGMAVAIFGFARPESSDSLLTAIESSTNPFSHLVFSSCVRHGGPYFANRGSLHDCCWAILFFFSEIVIRFFLQGNQDQGYGCQVHHVTQDEVTKWKEEIKIRMHEKKNWEQSISDKIWENSCSKKTKWRVTPSHLFPCLHPSPLPAYLSRSHRNSGC